MDRFFDELDLRDIRVDRDGARFSPDAQEGAPGDATAPPTESGTHGGGREDGAPGGLVRATGRRATERLTGAALPDETRQAEGGARADHDSAPQDEGGPAPQDDDGPAPQDEGDDVLRVSARSRPSAVAGAIAGVVREVGRAEVQAIGAGATNQAVKAVAIARDYLHETGIEVICLPGFIDVTIADEGRTAIRLVVEPR